MLTAETLQKRIDKHTADLRMRAEQLTRARDTAARELGGGLLNAKQLAAEAAEIAQIESDVNAKRAVLQELQMLRRRCR